MVKNVNNEESMLAEQGYITTLNPVSCLKKICGCSEIDIDRVNKTASMGGIYVARDGTILDGYDTDTEREAAFKIVPTGLTTKFSNEPVLASFVSTVKGWQGVYFGTAFSIFSSYEGHCETKFNNQWKRVLMSGDRSIDIEGFGGKQFKQNGDKADFEKSESSEQVEFTASASEMGYKEIYDKLILKEKFLENHYCNLKFYIRNLVRAVINNKNDNDDPEAVSGNGYICSEDKKNLLINTGLLNTYDNFIYIVTPNENTDKPVKFDVVKSKTDILNYGFKAESLKNMPEKFKFVEDVSELVFKASLDDFDLDDEYHFSHIIVQRIDRFPEEYQSVSNKELCEKIKNSIVHAVKMSQVDYRYIVPKYDLASKSIQFLIPLYLDENIGETTELVLVIAKRQGFWQAVTVLGVNDAYNNARVLCNPCSTWLK